MMVGCAIDVVFKRKEIVFAGKCLRGKCEQDKKLGYELFRRLVGVSTQRLEAAMLQVIELSK